jgi:hypothetical protein
MVELTADNKLSNKNNETVETRVKPINDMVDNKLQQDSVNYNENDVGTSSEAKGVHIRNRLISGGSTIQHDWVEQTFNKRECAAFISTSKDKNRFKL